MGPIHIFILVFAIFSLSRVILRYKDGRVTNAGLLFWVVVWISIIIVGVNPGTVSGWLSYALGVNRPLEQVTYISIIIIFYLIFRIYVKLAEIEQNTTAIVRHAAKESKKKVIKRKH